jgi:hypothetical protein
MIEASECFQEKLRRCKNAYQELVTKKRVRIFVFLGGTQYWGDSPISLRPPATRGRVRQSSHATRFDDRLKAGAQLET